MVNDGKNIGLSKESLYQQSVLFAKTVLYFMDQVDDAVGLLTQLITGHHPVCHDFLKRRLLSYHLVDVDKSLFVEYHIKKV